MDNGLKKVKFVKMRTLGLTYEEISTELKISKPTLVVWAKELKDELHNERELKVQELNKQYNLTQERKIKLQALLLDKIESAIIASDFKNMSQEKLLKSAIEVSKSIDDSTVFKASGFQFNIGDNIEWRG